MRFYVNVDLCIANIISYSCLLSTSLDNLLITQISLPRLGEIVLYRQAFKRGCITCAITKIMYST